MSIHLVSDTGTALGANVDHCQNRSLFIDRFADPTLREEPRKQWFSRGIKLSVEPLAKIRDRRLNLPAEQLLHARLQSRLLVNMAGGVMENAGLCLDRYGLPYLPGSTVKGCARRMALQALHDWIEARSDRPAADDIGSPCCEGFSKPADLLAAIALVFGWVEQDWNSDKNRDKQTHQETTWKSDFAWACHGDFQSIWRTAATALCRQFRAIISDPDQPWKSLPNCAGSVAFLAAYPNTDPGLELDVVTCHHGDYYSGKKDNQGRLVMPIATDTEEPIPVLFPAVKPQKETDYFSFPLIPLRNADPKLLAAAKSWLANGLEIFGLGGKTNAGYGWFDASDELNLNVKDGLARKTKAEVEERERQAAAQREAGVAEQRRLVKAALEAMTPDERIASLTEPQFDAKIRAFWKESKRGGPTEDEKKAIIAALKGPRLAYWQDLKTKASKGGDLAKSEQAIRAHNKQLNADKMP